jgi:hypothetical protein
MSDLYLGPNRITVDIETRAGVRTGPGPLTTVLSLDYGYRLSESGDFSALIALSDPRAALILPKSVVLAFYFDNELIFKGIVEHTSKTVDQAGVLRLTVRGRDLTAELAESPVGELDISNGAGSGVTTGPSEIIAAANAFNISPDWSLDTTDGYSTTVALLYGKYSGESALTALVMAAQKSGEHFRVATDGTRKIVWLRTHTPDSGVRAIQTAGEPVQAESNPYICFIQGFAEEVDAYALISRIYPYGAGDGEMRLTLAHTTRSAPTDFTLSAANNYIESDNAVTAIGKSIGIPIRFQDIRAISNTTSDMVSAANQLFDAAIEYLKRYDATADLKTFRLTVLKLPARVQCGEIITVEYAAPGYTVDGEQMVVLAIRNRINSSGVRTSELTVAGVARWLDGVSREIVGQMEQSKLFTSHPQRGPNSYVTAYQKYVWRSGVTSEVAQIRFRFGLEISQLNQVAFDFETDDGTRMLPLESTVRSVAGVSTTTDSGGSSAPTSSGDTAHTHTVTIAGHTHDVTIAAHDHTVTVAAHDHDIPDHQHDITIIGNGVGALTYDIGYGAGGTAGGIRHNIGLSDHTFPTDSGSGGTTSDSGGGQTPTSSSGGGQTPTSASGGSSAPTSSGGSNHSHTVTIAGHTHDVTANVTATYGVYRESNSLTFNITDLEYQVNSGGWEDLSADAVSLGSNWYRLDITELLYDSNFVPNQASNLLEFRRKEAGSYASRVSCMIDGQLLVRNIIQSVSLT